MVLVGLHSAHRLWGKAVITEINASQQTFPFPTQFTKACYAIVGTHAALAGHEQLGIAATTATFTIGLDTQNTKTYSVQWLAFGV